MKSYRRALMSMLALLPIVPVGLSAQESEDETIVLEEFIVEETAGLLENSLLQTDRPISSLGFGNRNIVDIPRAVTPLSPETLEQYQIDDVYDLARVVPGATVINFYGVPGIPTTRGLFTGLYFNGMQRVWNRNGYPTSFGSLEALEHVKGPPPPSYSAASPGGFVNFVPKSPYFDEFRGSVELEAGRWDHYKVQLDVGGPFLLGDMPAAFRLSLAQQEADSYYDGIHNDFTSLYGAIKVKVNDKLTIFAGGEYFDYDSKENPGWNRVTQDLIDRGEYIVGNPVTSAIDPNTGIVDRRILESATPFGGTYGDYFGSFDFNLATNAFNPDDPNAAFFQTLGAIDNPTPNDPTTVRIGGNTVLTDPDDFVIAETYLAFFDMEFEKSPDTTITLKSFFDGYEREKYSTYGYAEYGENYTFEEKLIVDQSVEPLGAFPMQLSYGVSARYEDSLALTDFTVEPFSRRDITQPIDPNTVLPAGADISPAGTSYWDPFGSNESELWTLGAFFNASIELTEDLNLDFGYRRDKADWDTIRPTDRNIADLGFASPGDVLTEDEKYYSNYTISPSYKVTDDVTVYYTYQKGTSFQGFYVSGGVSSGDQNFQESELHEFGVRASLLDEKLFLGATYYEQELTDFDSRSGAANPQSGEGIELEATWLVNDKLTVQAVGSWQEHRYDTPTLQGGFVPLTPEELVQYAGIFYAEFSNPMTSRPNPGGARFGIPEYTGSLFVKYDIGNGFGISGGPTYTDSIYINPDKTIKAPDHLVWNANVYYKSDRFDVIVSGSNLTDEDIFYASDLFAGNAIVTKAPPVSWNIKVKYKF